MKRGILIIVSILIASAYIFGIQSACEYCGTVFAEDEAGAASASDLSGGAIGATRIRAATISTAASASDLSGGAIGQDDAAPAGIDSGAEQNIPVKDIEVGEYKSEIMIGETVDITAKVLPGNATDQTISYWSTDEDVAVVNSNGQIRGVGKGKTVIVLKAGQKEKGLKISVPGAKTESITLNKDYVVLKPGKTFKITARVMPQNAVQKLDYQSGNSNVITVSDNGVIKAVGTGSTFATVSNGDMTASVSVIVNMTQPGVGSGNKKTGAKDKKPGDSDDKDSDAKGAKIIKEIEKSDAGVVVRQEEYPVLSGAVLKALGKTKTMLTVEAGKYSLVIDGADIINPENELSTYIDFRNEKKGIGFTVNNGLNMPGRISVVLKQIEDKAYLYLYNDSIRKYQRLDAGPGPSLVLDEAGKYLLTDEKLSALTIGQQWIVIAAAVISACIILFIVIRRRYWFW